MRILVLGASGMLGNAIIRILTESDNFDIFGTIRSKEVESFFSSEIAEKLIVGCDVLSDSSLNDVFDNVQPDVVINCVSLSKQLLSDSDPLLMIPIYSLLPHRLSKLCRTIGARLIHMSTDGVFSGNTGNYVEGDLADARDIYGVTKFLGEVHSPHTINIRSSIIGHELNSNNGLVEWFLSQEQECVCYSRVIFSGFPVIILAQIIRDIVIPKPELSGVYHIASNPISKCALLRLIADVYNKSITITENDKFAVNRSLNSERFNSVTGYTPPSWGKMVKLMYSYK